jgi:D-glycero-D-manno-heptose 1,7-bisphosphate phosphatase
MHPAIFLDRDGVIIENRADYIRSWSDVVFLPKSLPALIEASRSAYKLVIVTNQSVVGRGIISLEAAHSINRRLVAEVEKAGGRIDAIYMCPHAPADGCFCRKPQPGMLLAASQALSLDLGRSIMIGDALSDLRAGWSAGLKTNALVLTGRGAEQVSLIKTVGDGPYLVFDTLLSALADLIHRR